MADRKNRNIVPKEGLSAQDAADSLVKKHVRSAKLMDAVDTMATDHIMEPTDVFYNEEVGVIVAQLSDTEAKSLAADPGIEAVEDDELVFALDGDVDDEEDGEEDTGALEEGVIEDDEEATREIDENLTQYERADEDDYDEVTPEEALAVSQLEPEIDDFDLNDESGRGRSYTGY